MSAPVTSPALAWLVELLDAVGSGPRGKLVRQCPAHEDAGPSLSLGEGRDGQILIRCHAGCTWRDVLRSLALRSTALTAPPSTPPASYARLFCTGVEFPALDLRGGAHPTGRGFRFEGEHAYGDRYWLLRYRHPVTGAKELSWECLNPHGDRVPGLLGTPTDLLPAYMEREVRKGILTGEPVVLVESESSVDALVRAGFYATTWAGGATSVKVAALRKALADPEDPTVTYPRTVVIPDNDGPGMEALAVLTSAGLAAHVITPEPGEDARDVLTRIGPAALRALIEENVR